MGNARYGVGLVCLNGHKVNGSSDTNPVFNSPFCDECGQATIDACPKCTAKIRGYCEIPGAIGFSWDVGRYCHQCGAAYPWTERGNEALAEAIGELEGLTEGERCKLRESIPDVVNATPKTDAAAARFKKAIGKAGRVGGKLLTDTLTKVAVEAVAKSLGV